MLAPHELKNKTFSKAVRGYNPSEVDDHIEFLVEKYTELYREYNDVNKKLRVVATRLDEIKGEEESIRSTLVNAQKMAERIIRDANDKADLITGAIKERCDAVIADFKQQMVKEKEEMWALRTSILDFKQDVFELYGRHIQELQSINVNALEEIILPDENKIVENIIGDVTDAVRNDNAEEKAETESNDLNPVTAAPVPAAVVAAPAVNEPAAEPFVIDNPVAEEKIIDSDILTPPEPVADDGEDFFIKSLESVQADS